MSWKNKLRPASLDNIPFKVLDHNAEVGGRNIVEHYFPGLGKTYPEDIGLKARSYQINAFVLGADYMDARDALIAACSKEGPLILVHPYLGNLDVVCNGCRLSETTAEGGIAYLALSFLPAGGAHYPTTVATDTKAKVSDAALQAQAASKASFVADFSVSGTSSFVTSSAVDMLGIASTSMLDMVARYGYGGIGFDVTDTISRLGSTALTLVRNPDSLVGAAFDAVGSMVDAVGTPVVDALGSTIGQSDLMQSQFVSDLVNVGQIALDVVPLTTVNRIRQGRNQEAFLDMFRRATRIAGVQVAADTRFDTRSDAYGIRDLVVDVIDQELDIASSKGDDRVFDSFSTLLSTTVNHINARALNTADLISVPLPSIRPSLVQAYDLYEDPSRADEIALRNRVSHPGFLVGGRSLEVKAYE